ncbi:glycosyltransferase family 2 protein [Chryseobacterium echinoideorum]|uniref:glycosyltransferase family 2 protein n=1 Tax=Chryseobacterium echinoideorum TaxID=1549648 RepID=UPI001185704D|nr:glycosyltransferase family 2 protein [Chryseobacterium echinoideorum]
MTQKSQKIAVVILNWNGKNWLQKFLPSVINHSSEANIYVIDNQSTDDSVELLHKEFPTVQIVINDKNLGFAGGYNEGLKKIDAEYYCLLNSDVEVTENWIMPVLDLFEQNHSIAAIQPKILSYENKNKFEFAGAAGGLIDNLGYPYCRGRIFDDVEEDLGQYDDEKEIFWASGCCFFIRSHDFWEQKGFDERFFAHQEEIDLCWRLINSGKKVYYTGKSKIYHVGGGTLNKQSPRKTYLNMRNNLSMMLKNLPFPKLLAIIFLRMILDGAASFYFGYKNGIAHFWAVAKAHYGFYIHIPGTIKRRQKKQTSNYYQSKWLIFKHFLQNNKA